MRFLFTILLGTPVDSIEGRDLLDDIKSYDDWEHSILSQRKDFRQRLRRRSQLLKAEMLFIDTRAMGVRTAEPEPPTRSCCKTGSIKRQGVLAKRTTSQKKA